MTVTEAVLTPEDLILTAFAPTTSAKCPHCGTVSTRVHSYYTRRPRDLPVSGQSVRLVLQVRRFRCLTTECPATTFTERLSALVAPAAQRTMRLNAALCELALAFGGEAGARQSERSAMQASGDTLLRRAHAATPPARPTPRVLGIDDFSCPKGQVFGTILTDGESHKVVDLLPDRTADTAAAWLHEHPGIEIVTRDRSADYTRAATTGAPQAVQVADRFHLVKNAGETLERVVQRNHRGLGLAARAIDQERTQQTATVVDEPQLLAEQAAHPQPTSESLAHHSLAQQRRLAQYQEVIALAAEELGPKAIAQQVGLTRQIRRNLGFFPARPKMYSETPVRVS